MDPNPSSLLEDVQFLSSMLIFLSPTKIAVMLFISMCVTSGRDDEFRVGKDPVEQCGAYVLLKK